MRNPLRNRKLLSYAMAFLLLFAAVCSLKLGDEPIGPAVTSRDTTVTLTVITSRTQLKADGIDTAIISATLLDGKKNPLSGETILFSCNYGSIGPSATVDQSGKAVVTLTSALVNDTCLVRAISPQHHDTAVVGIVFGGLRLRLSSNATSLKIKDYATVTGLFTDGSDRPISGDSIVFTTRRPGHFSNNDTAFRATFNASGQAGVNVTSDSVGTLWVRASAKGLRDSIQITFDSISVIIIGSRQFHVYTSKNQLKANHSDTAMVTAILTDQNSNPVVGDTILFSCQPAGVGIIDSFAVIDRTGSASVTLRSTPVNGTCMIRATAVRSRDTASTTVTFSGVTVRLEADVTDLRINEFATITAFLTDASGNAIGGDTITFRARGGGRFANSDTAFRTTLDPSGKSTVRITSPAAGTSIVYAAALNTYDSMSILFTNNAISLIASKTTLTVGGGDSARLTATYLNGSGSPVAGIPIMFATNAGTIPAALDTTDAAGKAYAWIKSAAFSGTATVVASTSSGNAVVKITFAAAAVKSVKLAITPDNIGINGGIATLTATVRDVNDNMVSGADVNFRIIKGPGGGEYIDKPLVTAQNGTAHAQLYAGAVASMYRAVLVTASIGDTADTSKLTISGEPYAISVSRPQDDTVTVPNAGQLNPATFDYNVGAVVVDINGNPVADGTRVNFSMVVSGMAVHRLMFDHWAGLGSGASQDAKPIYRYGVWDIPFEDINNNLRRDPNDFTLPYLTGPGYVSQNPAIACRGDDVNGDGRCDFDPAVHDVWYDFNGNGIVDTGMTRIPSITRTPITHDTIVRIYKDTIIQDTVRVTPDTLILDTSIVISHLIIRTDTVGYRQDTTYTMEFAGAEPYITVSGVMIWADLYPDGVWNTSEIVVDNNHNGQYDIPSSGDRRWWEYENLPYWRGVPFDFDKNDFGVAVTTSANTEKGVANAKLTYPRQLARRLIVTVNAEANGVRDRNGQRFVLPVIVGSR